jgi:hypothetical protein
MAPVWLTAVAWLSLSVCFCCAAIIAYDIVFDHRRQPMGVMNFVFPITALYFGPFALALYWCWGRVAARTTAASMSMSRAAVSRAAAVSAGGGMPVRLDGDHGVRSVPATAPPDAQLGRLLAPHADRHDRRILHLVARKRLVGQPRHQGAHVSQRLLVHQRRMVGRGGAVQPRRVDCGGDDVGGGLQTHADEVVDLLVGVRLGEALREEEAEEVRPVDLPVRRLNLSQPS